MSRATGVTFRPAQLAEATCMAAMSPDLIEAQLPWRYRPAQMIAMVRDPDSIALTACNAASDRYGFAAMTLEQDTAHLALLCVQPAQQRSSAAASQLACSTG